MDVFTMPFATMGFTFDIIAFNQISTASKKIEDLEQRLSVLEGDET